MSNISDSLDLDRIALSPQSFDRFAKFITRELGIKMPKAKRTMLQSRLMRRLRYLELPNLEAYQEFLFRSPDASDEMVHFIDAVTTNKTDFFREDQHFEFLARTALPELERIHPRGQPERWNFWCAGCSSGEEPYTLAMVLNEYGRQSPGFDFRILATDISMRMLEHARLAIYEESRIEPIPPALRSKYLLRGKNPSRRVFRIDPRLRAKVTFRRLNLMDDDYRVRETFDAIFFRNVMIYFDKPTQESVIQKLSHNLRAGGYLFTGHSESLSGLEIPVIPIGTAIYLKPAEGSPANDHSSIHRLSLTEHFRSPSNSQM